MYVPHSSYDPIYLHMYNLNLYIYIAYIYHISFYGSSIHINLISSLFLSLHLAASAGLEVDAVMPWTLDTMKVDECFNRVHLTLGA